MYALSRPSDSVRSRNQYARPSGAAAIVRRSIVLASRAHAASGTPALSAARSTSYSAASALTAVQVISTASAIALASTPPGTGTGGGT